MAEAHPRRTLLSYAWAYGSTARKSFRKNSNRQVHVGPLALPGGPAHGVHAYACYITGHTLWPAHHAPRIALRALGPPLGPRRCAGPHTAFTAAHACVLARPAAQPARDHPRTSIALPQHAHGMHKITSNCPHEHCDATCTWVAFLHEPYLGLPCWPDAPPKWPIDCTFGASIDLLPRPIHADP